MEKPLNEMSNEELWQLFPIIISEHKNCWKLYYKEEKDILNNILKNNIIRIHHIGSTAVPNLPAKPTIDILVEIKDDADTGSIIKKMEEKSYICSRQLLKPAPHIMFMKGYSSQGFEEKVYHIHVRYSGNWDELHFRDYLIKHPETAKEYGELKIRLSELYKHDRDAYTLAKTDFIKKVTEKAQK